jgi:hypothetical protein
LKYWNSISDAIADLGKAEEISAIFAAEERSID